MNDKEKQKPIQLEQYVFALSFTQDSLRDEAAILVGDYLIIREKTTIKIYQKRNPIC